MRGSSGGQAGAGRRGGGLGALALGLMLGVATGCPAAERADGVAGSGGQAGAVPTLDAGAMAGGTGGLGGGSGGAGGSGDAGSTRDGGVSPDAANPAADDAAIDAGDTPATRTFPTDRAEFGLGGPSRCADAELLLCDGFEGANLDTATWEVQTWGSGSASLDATRAARGSKSVHIAEPAAVSRVMLRETRTFATTGNHFFGRFFLYLNYTPPALSCNGGGCSNLVHWTAAAAGGDFVDGSTSYRPDVRAVGAVNQRLLVNLDGAPVPEVGLDDDGSVPGYEALDASHTGEWMCFEFEYAGEGAAAEVRVYWDGLDHPGLHYSTTNRGDTGELWSIPGYDYLEFGFTHYQDYGAFVSGFDAWIDEVAVDDERIGCAL